MTYEEFCEHVNEKIKDLRELGCSVEIRKINFIDKNKSNKVYLDVDWKQSENVEFIFNKFDSPAISPKNTTNLLPIQSIAYERSLNVYVVIIDHLRNEGLYKIELNDNSVCMCEITKVLPVNPTHLTRVGTRVCTLWNLQPNFDHVPIDYTLNRKWRVWGTLIKFYASPFPYYEVLHDDSTIAMYICEELVLVTYNLTLSLLNLLKVRHN